MITQKEIVKASTQVRENIYKLNAEKKLQFLLDSKAKSSEIVNCLNTILPENMPVDLLAKIEVTEDNSEVLIGSWKKLINNLIADIGDLNKASLSKESNNKIKKADVDLTNIRFFIYEI